MKHTFLLITAGSHGDVFPFLGLGTRLAAMGQRVILVTAEPYRAAALEHGLEFEALMTSRQLAYFLSHPDVWHPVKSAFLGAKFGRDSLAPNYEILARLATAEPNVVMAAYPAVLAARVVQEKLGTPLISIVTMPWMIPSAVAPPVLSTGTNLSTAWPLWMRRVLAAGLHGIGDLLVGRHVNRFRRTLGLPPVRRVFQWWFAPQRVITLFPEWFAPPAPDWPPNVLNAGFPLFSVGQEHSLEPELAEFCDAGDPPVVLTFGTAMLQGRKWFAESLEACGRAGRRALVLTTHREQLPDPLPAFARHWPYAPFQRLFPLCAAVVHHGGIGTCSQALAAGIPQLILPMAWDQYDNAMRIEKLGAGKGLQGAPRADRIAAALPEVLSAETKSRCKALARNFDNTDGLATAAAAIIAEPGRTSGAAGPSR